MYQIMRVMTRAALGGGSYSANHIRKEGRSQINNISFHLRKLEEEKPIKHTKQKNRNNKY